MADTVDQETRSRMMSGIRSRNTRPERILRAGLHARGLRFRLVPRSLPGRPDIVLTRHRTVVFVHGCFWHRHRCSLFRWPGTNRKFWRDKLEGNARRDQRKVEQLLSDGWSVAVVWECSLRGATAGQLSRTLDRMHAWIVRPRSRPVAREFA